MQRVKLFALAQNIVSSKTRQLQFKKDLLHNKIFEKVPIARNQLSFNYMKDIETF